MAVTSSAGGLRSSAEELHAARRSADGPQRSAEGPRRLADGPRRSVDGLRQDLMGGLAAAVVDKGYAASTIADIVTHARVSKRTFYEHFADKEECLMALYAQGCETLRTVLVSAATAARGAAWQQVVFTTVNAYLSAMESMPTVTRTLLVEVQAAGPRAYRLRQQMQARFADTVVALVDAGRTMNPSSGPGPLSPELALALVGGINELLLQASDPYTGTAAPFTALADPVVRLVSAVLSYEPPAHEPPAFEPPAHEPPAFEPPTFGPPPE